MYAREHFDAHDIVFVVIFFFYIFLISLCQNHKRQVHV